jgi:long-chain alkane monooxygenase
MTVIRPIRLNAFDVACVGHIQHGMWAHPRDRSSEYASLDYWVDLAAAGVRAVSRIVSRDMRGAYDVYGGNADALLKLGLKPQAKVLDVKSRVRCRGCGTRGRAVVSVRWRRLSG